MGSEGGGDGRGGAEAAEFERLVSEAMELCRARGEAPAVWSAEVAKCVVSRGLELPSAELGQVLVSHLSSNFGEPSLWKFLDHAMASRLISSLHVLCLLTPRVLSCRQGQPEAYRLYLDLLARYTFSPEDFPSKASKDKIVRDIDANLQLSRIYGINVGELGQTLVIFFFSTIVSLIDSTMDDWGLQIASVGGLSGSFGSMEHHQRNVDIRGSRDYRRSGHREYIRNTNSLIAMEVLENLTRSRKALALLRLVHKDMPDKFNGLLQRLQFLETCKLPSPNLISAKEVLARLSSNIHKVLAFESDLKRSFIGMFLDMKSNKSVPCSDSSSALSACWVPFDLYMETAMDARLLPETSATAILTELTVTLQALNRASWQETFLALWLSALRLVQRERNPPEGPIPHLETRLCILLCIVPLAIPGVLMDDIDMSYTSSCDLSASILSDPGQDPGHGHMIDEKVHELRRNGFISSLQLLGQFSGLLYPPELVQDSANSAVAKAAVFTSKQMNGSDSISVGDHDVLVKCCGNMWHLIVEACIARRLIDTSAYFWPGYVHTSVLSIPDSSMKEMSPWSAFMEGGVLTASLISSLVATPATSFSEIEKLYYVALNGSNEEKSAAARIICGASLSRGWNIQEHVVKFVVKLLSHLVRHNGPQSYFVDSMPMLSAILFGASSIDTVHILSLHGAVPEVAAALMPFCEVYGSLNPLSSSESRTSEEPSVYMVFSAAFLLLLRLWKFYKPPLEGGGTIEAALTLEHLMLLHNSHISLASQDFAPQNEVNSSMNQTFFASDEPVYIDNYPRLRAWYNQNRSCVASPLSNLCSGSPVHQVANKILSMIYWKMTGSTSSSGNSSMTLTSSSLGGSPTSAGEEPYQRPVLCAWEVLEAIPFVLEAILTACAHGKLSSRDLTTGLRDLIDFLPASLAIIISYFSAEVTRGIWGPVPMNGIDWPSPTQTIRSVESEIKEILAAAGVQTPSYYPGVATTLPLPMAALVSLTITFKLDKSLEYLLAVAGPSMENCASYCPWPSIPIFGSLWAQKVRRWHNFIVVMCSQSVFRQNKEALAQLVRSCFTSFLGPLDDLNSPLTNQPCINGLLGNKISAHGVPPLMAPGFLYLRSCRFVQDKQYLSETILRLVVEYGSKLATRWAETSSSHLKSGQASLSLAAARIKEVGLLGASLLASAGGLHLAQDLFRGIIPTWLLTIREEKHGAETFASRMFEGYAMAYFAYLMGTFLFGSRVKAAPCAHARRSRIFGVHMDFLARVLVGNVPLGCHPVSWKAYISCLVGLVVSFSPAWVREVKHETLVRLARGLWEWHECELALALLERGGFATVGPLAEFFSVMD